MTAKKAQISTMILLVVPLGFSTGTELLKTMAHKSHTDFPIVKVDPPASAHNDGGKKRVRNKERRLSLMSGGNIIFEHDTKVYTVAMECRFKLYFPE